MDPAATDGELDIRLAIKERKTVPFRTSDTSAGPLIYAGGKRKLSAWAADDGRLLRAEFYQAAQRLAEQIVERVFAG